MQVQICSGVHLPGVLMYITMSGKESECARRHSEGITRGRVETEVRHCSKLHDEM